MLALALANASSAACGDGNRDGTSEEGALPWDQGGEDIPEYSLGRLLISDGSASHITVFDLDNDSSVGTIEASPRARVYSGAAGRYGYIHDSEASLLRAMDPGQWLLSHIDHFHVAKSELGYRGEQLAVTSVGSFASHEGWVALTDNARGQAIVFQERSITAMAFAPAVIAGTAHRGVAVVSHAHVFMSELSEDGTWGVGVRDVLQPAEREQFVLDCTEPGSIAADGDYVYLACEEGLLSLRWRGSDASGLEVARAAEAAARARLVRTVPGLEAALYDRDARTLAMWAEQEVVHEVKLDSEILDVQIRRQGTAALVLTVDGLLREIALPELELGRSVRVTEPVADAQSAPRFVLSHAYAYVADVREPDVRAVRLRDMAIEGMLAIGGEPFDLAIAGMPASYTDARE